MIFVTIENFAIQVGWIKNLNTIKKVIINNQNYFEGTVKLYKQEFYVNSNTGEGVDKVLKKIDPLLFKMSNKLFIPNLLPADVKQELAIIVIEGIRAYNPNKNASLSTFLHIHLHNKIITKINSGNKIRNNASSLSQSNSLPAVCQCGSYKFFINNKNGEEISRECMSCEKIYKKDLKVALKEVPFTEIEDRSASLNKDKCSFEVLIGDDAQIFGHRSSGIEKSETESCIDSICNAISDEKTAEIVRLISLDGLSIKDAAEAVGLSHWAANLKLKRLSSSKKIRDMLKKE